MKQGSVWSDGAEEAPQDCFSVEAGTGYMQDPVSSGTSQTLDDQRSMRYAESTEQGL